MDRISKFLFPELLNLRNICAVKFQRALKLQINLKFQFVGEVQIYKNKFLILHFITEL